MELIQLRKLLFQPLRAAPIILGWGTCIAGVTLWAMFQGLLLPQGTLGGTPPLDVYQTESIRLVLYYSGLIAASIISGLIIGDLGKAVGSFFVAYVLAAAIVFFVIATPAFVGSYVGYTTVLVNTSVDLTFRAFFPFPLFFGLFAALIGSALEERLLG